MKQLLQLCEELMIQKFFFIPKFLNNNNYDELEDFILTKSPYHSSIFNICWVKKVNPIYFENSVRRIIDYFSPKPFAIWFGPSISPNEEEQILNSLGFIKNTFKLGMVCDLNEFQFKQDHFGKSEVIEIRSEEELEYFLEVIEEAEPCARGFFKKVSNDLGFANHKPYHFFYLSLLGKPICIASLYFQNEICGLFDLYTHPDYRKKGYALNMLNSLLNYAKENGAKFLSFTASAPLEFDMNKLIQIYKNFGFKEQGEYSCYEYEGSGF